MMKGLEFENKGELDKAYEIYKAVADGGNAAAMHAIGNLYFYKMYKGTAVPNTFAMPWSEKKYMPDYTSAFSWFLKAAENGSSDAMNNVGVMLYSGTGCEKNSEEAHRWLIKAANSGNAYSIKALKDMFGEDYSPTLSDEEYDNMLETFCRQVESDGSSDLWGRLILGTDAQLSRLGYRIAVGRYNVSEKYADIPFPQLSRGRPCAPILHFRRGWACFIIVNLEAFPEENPQIAFSSDISQTITPVFRIRKSGSTTYLADDLFWLKGERKATLLTAGKDTIPDEEIDLSGKYVIPYCVETSLFKQVLEDLQFTENEAVFIENGEKEYEVEISHVTDGKVKIIDRYTIW